jgi:hypothetical protein
VHNNGILNSSQTLMIEGQLACCMGSCHETGSESRVTVDYNIRMDETDGVKRRASGDCLASQFR